MAVSEFFDREQVDPHDRFQRWRAENSGGLFINCRASGGWMLHRVACPHHGTTDWQAGDEWGSLTRTRKACASNEAELREWARRRGVALLQTCSDCWRTADRATPGR
jgi:hypothetical protein